MSNEWENIGNKLKSSLEQHHESELIDPWCELEKRVKRSNFLKFSTTTFNIYYLSVIVAFGFWASFSTYRVIDFNHQLKRHNQLTQNVDSINRNNSKLAENPAQKTTDSASVRPLKKNTPKNSSLHRNALAMNMEESALFEGLIASNYRSNDINVSFPRINYTYNTGQPIVFKINGDLSEPLILILYNNKGEEIFERKNLSNNSISINNNLLPGLYYWKLLKYNDLLQTGKFFIK